MIVKRKALWKGDCKETVNRQTDRQTERLLKRGRQRGRQTDKTERLLERRKRGRQRACEPESDLEALFLNFVACPLLCQLGLHRLGNG